MIDYSLEVTSSSYSCFVIVENTTITAAVRVIAKLTGFVRVTAIIKG